MDTLEYQLSSLIGRSKTEAHVSMVLDLVEKSGLSKEEIAYLKKAANDKVEFLKEQESRWVSDMVGIKIFLAPEADTPILEPCGTVAE